MQHKPLDVQLQMSSDKSYELKVLGIVTKKGVCSGSCSFKDDPDLQCILRQLADPNYDICPGIQNYNTYFEKIRYDSKHVRKWTHTGRVDSQNCQLWHDAPERRNAEYLKMCEACVRLCTRLKDLVKKAADTPTKSEKSKTIIQQTT